MHVLADNLAALGGDLLCEHKNAEAEEYMRQASKLGSFDATQWLQNARNYNRFDNPDPSQLEN